MPRRARCKGVTQYGKQCQYHADKEGLCPVHFRMKHGEKGRNQPEGNGKAAEKTPGRLPVNTQVASWLLNEATPEEFEQFVALRKLPAMIPLLRLEA